MTTEIVITFASGHVIHVGISSLLSHEVRAK